MKSPCFNEETKTDCPDRCQGCASTCEKWAKYIEARDEEYENRKKRGEAISAANSIYYHNRTRYLQYKAKRMNRRPKMR